MINLKTQEENPYVMYHSLRKFMLIQLLFGYDHGYVETSSKVLKYFVKAICIAIALSIVFVILNDCGSTDNLRTVWYVFYAMEYMVSTIIILLTKVQISSYFKSFRDVDVILHIRRKHYVSLQVRITIVIILTIGSRIIYGAFFCNCYPSKCLKSYVASVLAYHPLLALDCLRALTFMSRFCIYYRLKTLRIMIGHKYSGKARICWDKGTDVNKYDITVFQDTYKILADNSDLIKPTFDAVFAMSLIINIPKLMLLIYELLIIAKSQMDLVQLFFTLFNLCHITGLLWGPCVISELATAEVDRIKIILYNYLLKGEDVKSSREIRFFLNYAELRTFQYRAYRFIPVDLTLPLLILSICTTYLIVIIQFTHLYG